jgi:hypothetical protein
MTRGRRVLIVLRMVAIVVGLALVTVGSSLDNHLMVRGAIVALATSVIIGLLLRAQARCAGPPEPEPGSHRDPAPPEE